MHRSNGQLHGNFPTKAAFFCFHSQSGILVSGKINLSRWKVLFPSWTSSFLPISFSDFNELLMGNNQIERLFKCVRRMRGLTWKGKRMWMDKIIRINATEDKFCLVAAKQLWKKTLVKFSYEIFFYFYLFYHA